MGKSTPYKKLLRSCVNQRKKPVCIIAVEKPIIAPNQVSSDHMPEAAEISFHSTILKQSMKLTPRNPTQVVLMPVQVSVLQRDKTIRKTPAARYSFFAIGGRAARRAAVCPANASRFCRVGGQSR